MRLYFAYGSNMSQRRLRQRCPSAEAQGNYRLYQHRLCFHKVGQDGSAKCDAYYSADASDVILGVLYRIADADIATLDRIEGVGRGYEQKQVRVKDDQQGWLEAFTYYATRIDKSLKPFCWYLYHVLAGAREAGLPADYVVQLAAQDCLPDRDAQRDWLERSLYR